MRKFVKIVFVFFACLLMGCDFIPDSGTPSTKNDEVVISFYDGNTLIKKINGKKGDDFPNEVYEKEGFNFVGWDMNNDGNPDQMPIAVTSDVTLRAVLVKKAEYQCIFAYNGEAVSELIVEKGTKIESYDLELPTENEYTYTLLGWYIDDPDSPVSFPYEINANTVFYPLIEKRDRIYQYSIYDGDKLIYQKNGYYNESIDYPLMDDKIVDGKYAVFTNWDYETETGEPIDVAHIDNLSQNLIIKANYTTDQVFTVIIDDLIVSKIVDEGNILHLNYGKPDKNQKVAWYLDSEFNTKLTSNKMINGSLVIYGKYENIVEIDNSILEYDYENASEVNSEYEFLLLFNSLLLNKVESKEVTVNFDYESLNEVFNYLTANAINLRNYSFSVSYVDNVLNLNFTYEDKGGKVSNNTIYEQLPSYNISNIEKTRPDDYNDFYIENVDKVYKVVDSESLYYALEHGYKPVIDSNNEKLNELYNKMKNVLKDIIDDNMTDFEKIKAIYEWLIMNVTYDKEVLDISMSNPTSVNSYNAFLLEGVFNDHKAVCDGISKAMSCLANIEGIKCVRVTGSSVSSFINHAWNKVLIDGEWYIIDATSGGIIDGNNKEILTYEFFLISTNTYSKYYLDDNELYSFIETNYDYNSYSKIDVKVDGNNYKISFNNEADLVKVLTSFFKNELCKTFTFEMSYYKGSDIGSELGKVVFETNMNVEFTYLNSDNIITIILK